MENQNVNEESQKQVDELKTTEDNNLEKKLDIAGWGLLFVWIGIAFLTNLGFAAGLFGVGIITLGAQATRKYLKLKFEGFWIVVGLLFVIGGLAELFKVQTQLVPILIILAGLIMLVYAFYGDRLLKKSN